MKAAASLVCIFLGCVLLLTSVAALASQPPLGALQDVDILREQLRSAQLQIEMRDRFEEKLLSTVHWALGVLISVTVALMGLGWFATFKMHERDKKQIRDEALAEIQERIAEHQARMAREVKEQTQRLVEAATAGLSGTLARMRVDVSLAEAGRWRADGVFVNELRSLRDALDVALDLDDQYLSGRLLGPIEVCLDTLKDSSIKPDAALESQMSHTFSAAEKHHPLTVKRLVAKLVALKS